MTQQLITLLFNSIQHLKTSRPRLTGYQSLRMTSISATPTECIEKDATTYNLLSKPLVKFGVITDVQYADADDRPAWYDTSKTRYYRSSLDHVRQAFRYWTENTKSRTPSFALQLGWGQLSKCSCVTSKTRLPLLQRSDWRPQYSERIGSTGCTSNRSGILWPSSARLPCSR